MTSRAEQDFVEFIAGMCRGICSRLMNYYTPETVTAICDTFSAEGQEEIVNGLVANWSSCCGQQDKAGVDDLISILLINLVGPVNRVLHSRHAEDSDFNYQFLLLMDRLLHHENVRTRFVHFSQRLLSARAA